MSIKCLGTLSINGVLSDNNFYQKEISLRIIDILFYVHTVLEYTIYCTQGEHDDYYTTDVVLKNLKEFHKFD
jgi:hypothetical protein